MEGSVLNVMATSTYTEIKKLRDMEMYKVAFQHEELNQLHDRIMLEVVKLSISRTYNQYGPCPSPFSFIVMGSAGRSEQAIWSDQDHGLIYQDESDEVKEYFLKMGKEISVGLFETGYEYCDGDVMASNPLWCQSLTEWQHKLTNWTNKASWESIRHLLIFIDGRTLIGEESFIKELKVMVYQLIQKNHLLPRILDNTLHFKKGLGILGQFLVETHGKHTGSLNFKEKVLFPYVNAVRLLAIKENLFETSTIARIQQLPESALPLAEQKLIEKYFINTLNLRLRIGDHFNYDSGHYLVINKLTPSQKQELKDIIKFGTHFFQSSRKLVDHYGNE
jgi:CBS domain-containing protein